MKKKFLKPALVFLPAFATCLAYPVRAMAEDTEPVAAAKLVEGKVVAVANDPFVSVLQSEGIRLNGKEGGIRAFFDRGIPGAPDRVLGYEDWADIKIPPVPVPQRIYQMFGCKDAGSFLYFMANGGAQAVASGAAVSDTGKIYFWSLEANDLLDVTTTDGRRFTLHCDPKIFEGTQRLLDYPGQRPAVPANKLDPPHLEDVAAFANCPAKTVNFETKYDVPKERVLAFLKAPKKADLKTIIGAAMNPETTWASEIPVDERRLVTGIDGTPLAKIAGRLQEISCAAHGVLVTKKHEIYFWSWINPDLLYLSSESGDGCFLTK